MKGTGEKGQSAQEKALQLLTGSGDSESLQKLQDIQKRQKEKCYHNTQLLLRHFERVRLLAGRYGFRPMLWSDMFFRLAGGGEYYRRTAP